MHLNLTNQKKEKREDYLSQAEQLVCSEKVDYTRFACKNSVV